jgi:hypothetical protein
MAGARMDAMELLQVWTEEVWHAGNYDRVADCLDEIYVRHDRQGNRAVTRAEYAQYIRAIRERVRGIRFWNDDFVVTANRIWTRWRMTGTSAEKGDPVVLSGIQVYRVVDGRLAETWAATAPEGDDWSAPLP